MRAERSRQFSMIKRSPLSMRQKALLWDKQQGLCGICREKLEPGRFDDDHILALVDGGTNELGNRRLVCVPCHREKSAREHTANSKTKRLRFGKARKAPPMAGSRKSRLKKHMDGTVSVREFYDPLEQSKQWTKEWGKR